MIAISEVSQIEPTIINTLKEEKWLFPVKLMLSQQKLFAGQNRNIACSNASGEIFICQDADDIPHPQRIEVIKYFFDKLGFDFLLHKFVYNDSNAISQLKIIENISSLEYFYVKSYYQAWLMNYVLFGQPAIHRSIFQRIQWPNVPIGEDNAFDSNVINNFNKCVVLTVPLYLYRLELSATPYELYRLISPVIKSLVDIYRNIPSVIFSNQAGPMV